MLIILVLNQYYVNPAKYRSKEEVESYKDQDPIEHGMHNLESLYKNKDNESLHVPLHPKILEEQLNKVKFQQLLYERRLKTDSFENLLRSFQQQNAELINTLNLDIN